MGLQPENSAIRKPASSSLVMSEQELRRVISEATRLVRQQPEWMQNILRYSNQPSNPAPRPEVKSGTTMANHPRMGLARKPKVVVHLVRKEHKVVVQTEHGPLKIRYRRYRDKRGKWRMELIGPFDVRE